MKQQLSNVWKNLKEFWGKLSKKVKITIGIVAVAVVVMAIVLTRYLNASPEGYKVLYDKISDEETASVFATVQNMSIGGQTVTPEINSQGQVMVPEDKWDQIIWELFMQNAVPQSAPTYGIFQSMSGITTTEFEKIQGLTFQLQDRAQDTLERITGVQSAVVTLNIPEKSSYVWEETKEKASASVLIRTAPDIKFEPEQVLAVKTLVSHGVPQMLPEDVSVIDANTGLLMEDASQDDDIKSKSKQLDLQHQLEKGIEDNVYNLLKNFYEPGQISASASVTLEQKTTKTEAKQLTGKDDEGNGFLNHMDDSYTVNGQVSASGIVGEENNTDVPTYNATDPSANPDVPVSEYQRNFDYEYGYILEQTEDGNGLKVTNASVAVVIRAEDYYDEEVFVDLIASACGIEPDNVKVSNLDYVNPPAIPTDTEPDVVPQDNSRTIIIIAAIALGIILFVVAILVIIAVFRKKEALKKMEEEQKTEETIKTLQQEIDEHKKSIRDAAEASSGKENAITNEIRAFAKENPEITASLIRSMLKEDE